MATPQKLPKRPSLDAAHSDYDSFASVYSRWIGQDFAARVTPVVARLLAEHLRRGADVLDLCCGAGHVAAALIADGYRLTCVDACAGMLAIAGQIAPQASFVLADARDFSLPQRFDAVISTFNSFAHVETNDLECVFRNVRRVLRDDGLFLFDLTMEEAYRARWRGSFCSVGGDHTCVVRPAYDPEKKIATNFVTAFERSGDDETWKRSDFQIVQNCHAREAVESALARAGFPDVQIKDAQQDLGMSGEAGRQFFLCK
jgi:SAM-dependent methyltransferase